MQDLRPYQERLNAELLPAAFARVTAPVKRVVAAGPCGSGKTSMGVDRARRAGRRGNRTLVVAHRRRLVMQWAERAADFGLNYGVVMADLDAAGRWAVEDPAAPVQIASRDTLAAMLARGEPIPRAVLLEIDECHVGGRITAAIESACGCRFVVGSTATPCRPDGSGLSSRYWHALVEAATVEDLLARNYLVPVDVYAPVGVAAKRKKGLKVKCSGDPVRQWLDHAEGLRTVAFTRTVAESVALRDAFRAAGVRAEHLDAATPDADREAAIARLVAREIDVITNVDIVGVGVDIPELECVQLLTKCISPVRLRQPLGRCQRIAPGKTRGVLLDHAAATAEHGMPNVSPVWSLDEDDSVQNRTKARADADPNYRPVTCRACGLVSAGAAKCPGCGARLGGPPKGQAAGCDREPLRLYEGGDAPPPDPRQKYWTQTLYRAAALGWTCGRAGAVFKGKYGVWPDRAGVTPAYGFGKAGELVAVEFPHFGRRAQ